MNPAVPFRRRLSFAATALSFALSAGGLAGCERTAAPAGTAAAPAPTTTVKFNAVDLTGAEYAHDFHLVDPEGQVRSLADFKGKAVVVFFGYTHCPDACPTTMADLAATKKLMGPDGAKVAVVFVTVDPSRDTPALMKAYAANFGPDFTGLRGDEAQTKSVAKEFKVFYAQVPGKTAGDYTIDHTAGSYVFDPMGRVRLFVRTGTTPEAIADDLKALLHEGAAKT
jgi:protein SCO1/2